jgi:hypothetical protein
LAWNRQTGKDQVVAAVSLKGFSDQARAYLDELTERAPFKKEG